MYRACCSWHSSHLRVSGQNGGSQSDNKHEIGFKRVNESEEVCFQRQGAKEIPSQFLDLPPVAFKFQERERAMTVGRKLMELGTV